MEQAKKNPNEERNLVFATLLVVLVVAAVVAGRLATALNLIPWYEGLLKPSFSPPSWVFVHVWTALYALMAFAAWRIFRISERSNARLVALYLFFVQLLFNAAWPIVFFGANSPLLGLINIVPQLIAVLAAIVAFHRLDWIAAWCLVPIAVWVGFTAILNFAILRLSG